MVDATGRARQGGCLAPAIGAASKVGMLRSLGIERLNNRFGHTRHFVHTAMSKVNDLLRMSEGPACIDGRAGMTRIGCGRNVSCFQSLTELLCVD